MAKDIQWMGAIFPDVPSITLPQQGGGLASFDDTSDGDIQPADVAQGKIGYAQGQRVVGTAVAPSGSQTFTNNGTYDVTSIAEAVINVAGGGGGGLEYETGTFEPTSAIARPTISFTDTHTNRPFCVIIADVSESKATSRTNEYWYIVSWYDLFDTGVYGTATTQRYAYSQCGYMDSSTFSSNGNNITGLSNTSETEIGYWVTNTGFMPYSGSTSRYWRPERTYKWIAVWKPTT